MKKTKPGIGGVHGPDHLFRGTVLKSHRRLVLPRFLEEEAAKPINRGAEVDAAHAILVRWANLESDAHLDKDETSLDESFRQEVFGQALRYLTSTTSPGAYYYEKKFYVSGIGTPDGVLGHFPPVKAESIRAVIELKGAGTDLDHDKFDGRTPVQQCWDYLNNLPDCPWGIVSNFVSFRLYHRDKTQQAFEHFELQKLRDAEEFARFFALFERNGLLASNVIKVPRTLALMQRTQNRQREVGDKLYDYYSDQRIRLIEHLVGAHGHSADQALRAAQKLLDRIIFVAFCEDRGLLPPKLIDSTWKNVAPLARVTNPRWKNFLDMFHAIDKGHPSLDLPTGYNGGLFADDANVDSLDLEDQWTTVFHEIGEYDFAEDVNVDVLGHLFERSVSEVENRWVKGKREYLPLFEAKMTRDYDHRASKVVMNTKNWYMNYSAESASLVEHQNPEFLPAGRWWVDAKEVEERSPTSLKVAAIGFHDIARANDTRTMVACMIPFAAVSNTVPLLLNDGDLPWRRFCCLLGNMNSVPFDFVVRQKTGGAHLNFFIVEQIPTLAPDAYDDRCPWDKKQTLEKWVSDRVLKLTCTADDMRPFAEAAGFKEGVHKWKEPERADLRAELDAAYFRLYGISRDDAEYILSTFQGMTTGDEGSFTPISTSSRILDAYDALNA